MVKSKKEFKKELLENLAHLLHNSPEEVIEYWRRSETFLNEICNLYEKAINASQEELLEEIEKKLSHNPLGCMACSANEEMILKLKYLNIQDGKE